MTKNVVVRYCRNLDWTDVGGRSPNCRSLGQTDGTSDAENIRYQ